MNYLRTHRQKALMITTLVFAFALVATSAFAALTFSATEVSSSGALTLSSSGAFTVPTITLANGETISNATDGGVIVASSAGSIIGGDSNSSNPLLKVSTDTNSVAAGVRQGALSVTLNRPSTDALTSWDGNGDIALRVAATNRAANGANGGLRGMELSARNYTGAGESWISGIKATAEHSTGASNIATSTVGEFYMKNNATITTSHYGVLIQDDSQGTSSGNTYGLYITTAAYNPGGGRDAAIKVDSLGTSGWSYGLDLNDATPATSSVDIRLQNGETISNATDGTIAFGTTNLTNTGNITVSSGYINSPSYQVGQGATFTAAVNTPTKASFQQASYWPVVTTPNVVDVALIAMDQVDVGRHLVFSITAGGTNALTVSSGAGMTVVQAEAIAASGAAEDVGDAIDCLITTTATAFCTTYAAD